MSLFWYLPMIMMNNVYFCYDRFHCGCICIFHLICSDICNHCSDYMGFRSTADFLFLPSHSCIHSYLYSLHSISTINTITITIDTTHSLYTLLPIPILIIIIIIITITITDRWTQVYGSLPIITIIILINI